MVLGGQLPYHSKTVFEVVVSFPLSISFVSLNAMYQAVVILSKYVNKDVSFPFLSNLIKASNDSFFFLLLIKYGLITLKP